MSNSLPVVILIALVWCCGWPVAVAGESGIPAVNTALVPLPKIENDWYDWNARHEAVLKLKAGLNPEIVLIGDSIVHCWGGEPVAPKIHGPESWKALFGERKTLNLGFGWDRTQNVLWRLDNGEFDGLKPRFVVLSIGGNNFYGTANAKENTPAEVAEAVAAICARIKAKSPTSRLVVMGVFPRGQLPSDPIRAKISELNRLLSAVKPPSIFLDLSAKMLQADGTMSAELMGDFVHPTEKGYAIWAEALKGVFAAK